MSKIKSQQKVDKIDYNEVFSGNQNIQEQTISSYAEKAYLDYSVSVLKGRAIPSVEDGLKPVHRRILYAMYKEGMIFSSVHKKSARVVGNVLGLYHPHGDQSVYDALVRQAQDFSIRYPLIDGHGNFGSRDGDGAASMRYTEAKLSAITQLYLEEIKEECVDFLPNYDGTEIEPQFLPSRIPFILLNGNPGIAVGMATDIPCHNIKEVISATIACLENPNITLDEVLEHIKGPDFPTRGQIISPQSDIRKIYAEGRGSLKVRSKYHVETEGKNWKLVFNEIPMGTSCTKIMEEVDKIFNPELYIKKDKKITLEQARLKSLFTNVINKYNNASGKDNPVRLVFDPKSNKQDPEELAQILLASTSLESNVSTNFVVIGRDGAPVQKPLLEILFEWIDFRIETVTRRVVFQLRKIAERLHILEGRRIVLNHIDAVIELIKESERPKEDLIEKFKLSEIQAQDVLDLRLRQLGRLEADSIEKEEKELNKKKDDLQKIVATDKSLKKHIIKELNNDMQKFQDERITEIIEAQKVDLSLLQAKSAKVAEENITLAISEKGWVKILKGNKSPEDIAFKEGDKLNYYFYCKNTDTLAMFDIDGKIYNYPLNELTKDGCPINTLVQMNSRLSLACPINKDLKYILSQDQGLGFIVAGENLMTKMKAGKEMFRVEKTQNMLQPLSFNKENIEDYYFGVITTENKFLTYKLTEISEISKGKGIVLCNLPEEHKIKEIKLIKDKHVEFTVKIKDKEEDFIINSETFDTYVKGRSTKGSLLPLKDKNSVITFKIPVIETPIAK